MEKPLQTLKMATEKEEKKTNKKRNQSHIFMCPSAKNINGICLRSLVNVESVLAAAASCKNNKSHTNKLVFFCFLFLHARRLKS